MKTEIAIIGGGMIGVAAACALHTKFQISLIDASPPTFDDHRLIALNASSVSLLQCLDVWDALQPYAQAIHSVHVSEVGRFGKLNLNATDIGLSALGFVVPAKWINAVLYARLDKLSARIKVYKPAQLVGMKRVNDQMILDLLIGQHLQTLAADFVIAADGSASSVRQFNEMHTVMHHYDQTALVTVTQLKRSSGYVAYERFTQDGAIAILPLKGQACATIWTAPTAQIETLAKLSNAKFVTQLQSTFGYRVGRMLDIGPRYTYPLTQVTSQAILQENVLLLGNAAHTMSPLAAQGLNLGFAEIALLMQHLNNLQAPDLARYVQAQKKLSAFSSHLSHQLTENFASQSALLQALKPLAFVGLDLLKPVKNYFLRKAAKPYNI